MLRSNSRAGSRVRWLISGSALLAAGLWGAPVAAQATTDTLAKEQAETGDAAPSGEIVVTGSRIDRPGYTSPTPLTQISAAELSVASRPNIGAALADLPQFKASQSPQNSGTNAQAGRFPADLRGLGVVRTLVLLDGRRIASENDLATIPSILVRKVDIVTGGASAAWGSGAVAGVVNIGLDDRLQGLKLGAEGGISTRGDAAQQRLEGAFGGNFAGDRGHLLIGGEYVHNEGIVPKVSRPNTGRWVLLTNPNGSSTLTPDVGYANAVRGGIILSGVLTGQGFNPDGTLRTLARGTVFGANMVGGEAPSDDDISPLSTPFNRLAVLARVSYDVFAGAKLTADVRYSRYWDNYIWFGDHNRGGLTIRSDNAFLRPEVRERLRLAGQASFTLGRFNSDFAYSRIDVERKAAQATLALDGTAAGGRLRYSAFYSRGAYQNNLDTPGFRLTQPFNFAVDAVQVGSQIVCAATQPNGTVAANGVVLNRFNAAAAGCVPINLFGEGAPSAAATAYVTGTPKLRSTTRLDNAGISLRGEPFDLWAGAVSVAVGGEWRREGVVQRSGALDQAGAFTTFSFSQQFGSFTVKEAFVEALIPLAKDVPLLRDLNVNGAARISDYSTSGSIWSWKLGLTNEFVPGVIGRITRSRDIRSAALNELFGQATISYNNVVDPVKNVTVLALINGGGFAGLTPEKADTWTGGFTLAPMRGLTASIDYFDIEINNVITTIGAQDIVSRCNAGNLDLCARVFRDANGNLTRVVSAFVNLAEYKTNGIDGEIAYTLPIGPANQRLNFRVIGTWVDSLTTFDRVNRIEFLGNTNNFGFGVPEWRVNGSIGYADERSNALVRLRYLSKGFYNRNLNITNNRIPAYTYVDLQLGAKVPTPGGREMELYANVSNLFDKDPPIASLFSPYYDTVGRFVTLGARVRF